MSSWAYLKEGTPFNRFFPGDRVEILSIVPIIPREAGSPPCYVVQGDKLEIWQLEGLGEMLSRQWEPECKSLAEAIAYIVKEGLPLRCDWFSSCGTDDYFMIPRGAALNIAIRRSYDDECPR